MRNPGIEPQVLPPGLELMSVENALNRLGRDALHDAITDQLPAEFQAVPLAQ